MNSEQEQQKEEYIKDLFIKDISRADAQGSHIKKDDIIRIAEEYGINFKPKEGKSTIVEKIINAGFYKRLFKDFKEFVYIPVWKVSGYYKLNNEQIDKLKEIGVITADVKKDSFYSKSSRSVVYYNKYSIDVFNYTAEELLKAYNKAFGQEGFKVRIETKTEEEVNTIIELLSSIAIIKGVTSYEHRNQQGYYNYFTMELLNNSKVEGNRLLNEIEKLKAEINRIKEHNKEEIKEVNKKWCNAVGVESYIQAKDNKYVLEYYKNRAERLEERLKIKNTRGAGRKPKLPAETVEHIKQDREKGKTIRELAKVYNCSTGTICNILKK